MEDGKIKLIMSREKFGRSLSWANLGILAFTWTDRDLVRIPGILIKIQTEFLQPEGIPCQSAILSQF
jgi:hypothetical protein